MKYFTFLLFGCLVFSGYSQESLDDLLKRFNKASIPYISVQELAMPKTDVVLLDARELNEFKVSHLKNAICVGYNNFNLEEVSKNIKDKDQPIVVYCSLGIRSETVAKKLTVAGYTNVKNLYGGIFEWKNENKSVINSKNTETDSIHTFNKAWSKWLNNGVKVYPKITKNEN